MSEHDLHAQAKDFMERLRLADILDMEEPRLPEDEYAALHWRTAYVSPPCQAWTASRQPLLSRRYRLAADLPGWLWLSALLFCITLLLLAHVYGIAKGMEQFIPQEFPNG